MRSIYVPAFQYIVYLKRLCLQDVCVASEFITFFDSYLFKYMLFTMCIILKNYFYLFRLSLIKTSQTNKNQTKQNPDMSSHDPSGHF